MYFLEFEEMNHQGKCFITAPVYVDVETHVSNDHEDHIDWKDQEELMNACVKDLLDPLVKFIGDDPDMEIDEEEYNGDGSYITVSCSSDKVDSCVDKLVKKCQELDGTSTGDEEEFELDRDEPYVQDFDPNSWYGYVERPYRWSSEDEIYEYYHATLEVNVTFKYNEKYLEIYRE